MDDPTRASLLVVEDESAALAAVEKSLGGEYALRSAKTATAALDLIGRHPFSSVLFGLDLEGRSDFPTLRSLHRAAGRTPVVVLAEPRYREAAVRALGIGAFDWVTKPPDPDELKAVVRKSVEYHWMSGREMIAGIAMRADTIHLADIVHRGPPMKEVLRQAREAGQGMEPVVILGEGGTGKSMLARAIHADGLLRDRPFVTAHCGWMAAWELELALFGEEERTPTGSRVAERGLLEAAGRGTLLLDKISTELDWFKERVVDAILKGQACRVGGDTPWPVRVRLMASSHEKDPQGKDVDRALDPILKMFDGGRRILLPPLRERLEDIPALLDRFLAMSNREHGKSLRGFTDECRALLGGHSWPGNVAELRATVERLVLLEEAERVGTRHLPVNILLGKEGRPAPATLAPLRAAKGKFERQYVLEALAMADWNQTQAARMIGITRMSLSEKMAKYRIVLPPGRGRSRAE